MRLLPTNLVTELRADIVSAKSMPALTAGFTTGLGLLVAQVAFATFIFSGPLAPYSSQGVGLVLFGNFAGCLVVALTGGYRGAVAGLSPALVIVMALIATSMDGDGLGLFVNATVALILGAVIAGAVCLLIGRFRLANLVRFIPYPVAAGFVAGIGVVVCLSAVSMMSVELSWRTLPALLEPGALWKWTPGVLFGLALYAALKQWGRRLPWTEYSIIVVIALAIIWFGLLEGVGAGMLAMLVFFAVRLSRVDPIAMRFTARERHSNRIRPAPDRAILINDGNRVRGYALRGYIFFGSVGTLIDQLRVALDTETPVCLILDFKAVTGFDFSAVNGLSRFLQTAQASGVQVVLSAPSERLTTGLEHNLAPAVFEQVVIEPSDDTALERGEEIVLAAWKAQAERSDEQRSSLLEHTAADLERQLEHQIQFEDLLEDVGRWMNPHSYQPGETMAGPDTSSPGLQFLVSGRATEQNDAGGRLVQYAPGDAIFNQAPCYCTRFAKWQIIIKVTLNWQDCGGQLLKHGSERRRPFPCTRSRYQDVFPPRHRVGVKSPATDHPPWQP